MRRQPPQSLVEFLAMNPPEGMPGPGEYAPPGPPIPLPRDRRSPPGQLKGWRQQSDGSWALMPVGPPPNSSFRDVQASNPAAHTNFADWQNAQTPLPHPAIAAPNARDPEPWRAPADGNVPGDNVEPVPLGGPARVGGLEPPSAAWRDDDVAFEQALARARAAIGQQRTVNNMAIGPAGRLTGMAPRRGVYGPIKRR